LGVEGVHAEAPNARAHRASGATRIQGRVGVVEAMLSLRRIVPTEGTGPLRRSSRFLHRRLR